MRNRIRRCLAVFALVVVCVTPGCDSDGKSGVTSDTFAGAVVLFGNYDPEFETYFGVAEGVFELRFGGPDGDSVDFVLESEALDPQLDASATGTMTVDPTGVCRFEFTAYLGPGQPQTRTYSCDRLVDDTFVIVRMRLTDDRDSAPTGAVAEGAVL